MGQNDPNTDSENYGGYAGDNDVLYPAGSPGFPTNDQYVHVPDGAPIHHDQVANFRPSNYLDFVTAGSPEELFHEFPAQFFNAFKVQKKRVIVPRTIPVPVGGSGLILQGKVDVYGVAFNGAATDVAIFRDGIDLSGQPVLPVTNTSQTYSALGVRFFNGVYVDFTKVTVLNFTPIIYTIQEFPAE